MCACGQAGVLSGVVPAAVLSGVVPAQARFWGWLCNWLWLVQHCHCFFFSFATRLPWFGAHVNERQHAALQWLFWARHGVWLQFNGDGEG